MANGRMNEWEVVQFSAKKIHAEMKWAAGRERNLFSVRQYVRSQTIFHAKAICSVCYIHICICYKFLSSSQKSRWSNLNFLIMSPVNYYFKRVKLVFSGFKTVFFFLLKGNKISSEKQIFKGVFHLTSLANLGGKHALFTPCPRVHARN